MTREEIEQLESGREMDIVIGRLMSHEPGTRWLVVDKEEGGTFIDFDYKCDADAYLAEAKRERPGGMMAKKGEVQAWQMWPRYSTDIAAAKLLLDTWPGAVALVKLEDGTYEAKFYPPGDSVDDAFTPIAAPTAELALCRARLVAALLTTLNSPAHEPQ